MIDFKLNREVIEILKKEGFHSDTLLTQYFILHSLYNGDTLSLNMLDDNMSSKRMILQYYDLLRRGFVEEGADRKSFSLTKEGADFIGKIQEFFEEPAIQTTVSELPLEDWFDEWMELWPKGVKTGGKLIRSDKKDCLDKMKKFIKKYNHSSETIISVTKEYLDEFSRQNYQYIKSATYFIDKRGEGSELAARCQEYKEGSSEEQISIENYNSGGLI
jgi:hypothetical protein